MIHQTAVIGSGAKIGANVEIGPHGVIGGAVTIGDDCVIGANVVIEGEVSIGRSNRIGHGAIIGGEPQDVGFSPATRSIPARSSRCGLRHYHCAQSSIGRSHSKQCRSQLDPPDG